LKPKFAAKRAKEAATSGEENFLDDNDDPFTQLKGDLLDEVKDHEAEKTQKQGDKKKQRRVPGC
jgi:hypothetical protein